MKLNKEVRHYFKLWQEALNVYQEINIEDVEFELVSLSDKNKFDFKSGIGAYVKAYLDKNPGDVPVCTGTNKNEGIGYHVKPRSESDVIFSKSVTFNKNGESKAFFRDYPYLMNRDHIAIIPDENEFNAKFLYYQMAMYFKDNLFGWGENTVSADIVKKHNVIKPKNENSKIQTILVEFIEYYQSKLEQYRHQISNFTEKMKSFDRAFLPAIFSAEKDPFIVEYFDQWAKKNNKELSLSSINFEYASIFENTKNISMIGSKKLGKHDEIEDINDADGLPVFDASSSILCYVSETRFPDKVFEVKDEENPDISFASEGNSSAGTNFHIHKGKYFVNNHRTVVKFLTDKFYSKYVYYRLLNMKEEYGFKRGYIPSQSELKSLDVSLWVPKGDDSFEAQKNIVEFIEEWRNWRDEIFQRVDKLSQSIDQAEELLIAKTFKGCDE